MSVSTRPRVTAKLIEQRIYTAARNELRGRDAIHVDVAQLESARDVWTVRLRHGDQQTSMPITRTQLGHSPAVRDAFLIALGAQMARSLAAG